MLTRFEKARVIGARVLQISLGAPVLIKVHKNTTATEIVRKEIEKGVLPLSALRRYPNGYEEIIDVRPEDLLIEW